MNYKRFVCYASDNKAKLYLISKDNECGNCNCCTVSRK